MSLPEPGIFDPDRWRLAMMRAKLSPHSMQPSQTRRAAVVAAMLGLAVFCGAQSIHPIAPRRGVYCAGFSFDYVRAQDGASETIFTAVPSYFLSDSLEVRVPLSFDNLLGNRQTIYGLGFRWHFGHGGLIDPFVGAQYAHESAGMGFWEDLTEAQAGFNYFVADNVAITTMLSIGQAQTRGASSTTTNLTSGFTIFFSER